MSALKKKAAKKRAKPLVWAPGKPDKVDALHTRVSNIEYHVSALAALLGPESTIYKRLAQIETDVSSGRFDEVHFKGWLDLVFAKQAKAEEVAQARWNGLYEAVFRIEGALVRQESDVKDLSASVSKLADELAAHTVTIEELKEGYGYAGEQYGALCARIDLSTGAITATLEKLVGLVTVTVKPVVNIDNVGQPELAVKLDELAAQVRLLTGKIHSGGHIPIPVLNGGGLRFCGARTCQGHPLEFLTQCALEPGEVPFTRPNPNITAAIALSPGVVKRAFAPRHDPDAPPR